MSVDFIDLRFRGSPRVIATALLNGPGGLTLIDPGPTSCLPALEAGLRDRGVTLRDVRTLVLTHIHLDHAGAAGTIVERVPGIRVYVHERGAPHLIDPSRLMASASRIYGDKMDTLWGPMVPVPAASGWISAARRCASPTRQDTRSTTSVISTSEPAWRTSATPAASA